MIRIILFLIRLYQLTIGCLLGECCRFYPSCSNYALDALHKYGALKGSWLSIKRICRCQPWNPGGVDEIP